MGLVQTENIMIYAEAYDVALDMSFPKGTYGLCLTIPHLKCPVETHVQHLRMLVRSLYGMNLC